MKIPIITIPKPDRCPRGWMNRPEVLNDIIQLAKTGIPARKAAKILTRAWGVNFSPGGIRAALARQGLDAQGYSEKDKPKRQALPGF